MITPIIIVVPLLPGKQEAWRQFYQTLQGSRCSHYDAWLKRMCITRQEVWLSQTWQGDLVCIHMEMEHPEHVATDLTISPHAFERWLRQQLLELHGVDLTQLTSASAHELIFAWSPAQQKDKIRRD